MNTPVLDIDSLVLARGGHPDHEAMCVMEAVAMLAGEEWSDSPQCASPVIAAFLRSWNDSLPDTERQHLKRHIRPLIGSRGTDAQESVRSWMAVDWLARVQAPAWLRLAGLTDAAVAIEVCGPITDSASAKKAQAALDDGRRQAAAARDAAGAAAGAAARAAARDAARAAARAALAPTVAVLQGSAHELVDRMLAVSA